VKYQYYEIHIWPHGGAVLKIVHVECSTSALKRLSQSVCGLSHKNVAHLWSNGSYTGCVRSQHCIPVRQFIMKTFMRWDSVLSAHIMSCYKDSHIAVSAVCLTCVLCNVKTTVIYSCGMAACPAICQTLSTVSSTSSTRHLWDTCFFCSRTNSLEFTARSSDRLRTV